MCVVRLIDAAEADVVSVLLCLHGGTGPHSIARGEHACLMGTHEWGSLCSDE